MIVLTFTISSLSTQRWQQSDRLVRKNIWFLTIVYLFGARLLSHYHIVQIMNFISGLTWLLDQIILSNPSKKILQFSDLLLTIFRVGTAPKILKSMSQDNVSLSGTFLLPIYLSDHLSLKPFSANLPNKLQFYCAHTNYIIFKLLKLIFIFYFIAKVYNKRFSIL